MEAQQRQADYIEQLLLGLKKVYNKAPAGFIPEHELVLSEAVLGQGGFGTVVLGKYNMQTVAVKRIFIGQASPSELATILREAQILEAVAANCRHVCRFLGYTIKGSYFCLVMHRYAKSLDVLISGSPGGLPLEQLERYAAQSMAALHELHRNKVVMLDFKPSNLLLDETQDAVVVADFGISRITDSINGHLTGSARGVGTPYYMAPEQLYFGHLCPEDRAKPPLTAAADIWAWGCSVIHMAKGSPPNFELAPMRGYMEKKVPAVPPHLPSYLRIILSKCLVVDPLERPSALEVLMTWQAVLQPKPGVQVPDAAKPSSLAKTSPNNTCAGSTSVVMDMLFTGAWRACLVWLCQCVLFHIIGSKGCVNLAVLFGMVAAWTWPIKTRQGVWGMACKFVFWTTLFLMARSLVEILYDAGFTDVGIPLHGALSFGMVAAWTWPSKTNRQGVWGMACKFVFWITLFFTI